MVSGTIEGKKKGIHQMKITFAGLFIIYIYSFFLIFDNSGNSLGVHVEINILYIWGGRLSAMV